MKAAISWLRQLRSTWSFSLVSLPFHWLNAEHIEVLRDGRTTWWKELGSPNYHVKKIHLQPGIPTLKFGDLLVTDVSITLVNT